MHVPGTRSNQQLLFWENILKSLNGRWLNVIGSCSNFFKMMLQLHVMLVMKLVQLMGYPMAHGLARRP